MVNNLALTIRAIAQSEYHKTICSHSHWRMITESEEGDIVGCPACEMIITIPHGIKQYLTDNYVKRGYNGNPSTN